MNTYVIILEKVPGHEMTKDTIAHHVDHLRRLNSDGRLVLCGPFSDHPSGMVVVRAESKSEATQIAESDPFVIDGARTYAVRTWLLASEENNYLA